MVSTFRILCNVYSVTYENVEVMRSEIENYFTCLWYVEIYCFILLIKIKISRVSLTYRVKSAHKVKLTDKQLLQWMVPILLVMLIYLGTWTLSAPPVAEQISDKTGLKFKQCSYNWWDHSLAIGTCNTGYSKWGKEFHHFLFFSRGGVISSLGHSSLLQCP